MHYGIKTEATAREDLQRKLGIRIVQAGLVVLPQQPWLCCSPDGLATIGSETVLIEIKCTFKYKEEPFIDYEERRSLLPYLMFDGDVIVLRPTHCYYTQMQVQLYILNLQWAIFYVYSPKHSVIVKVVRDEAFLWELIPKMEHFYFKFLIQRLF
ncbi:uncharacterized protein LOC144099309 [Amblyomma americanum]